MMHESRESTSNRKNRLSFFEDFTKEQSGQGLTEYGAMMAFVAIIIAMMFATGQGLQASVASLFSSPVNSLNAVAAYSGGGSSSDGGASDSGNPGSSSGAGGSSNSNSNSNSNARSGNSNSSNNANAGNSNRNNNNRNNNGNNGRGNGGNSGNTRFAR